MRVAIQDSHALRSVLPRDLVAYLQAKGLTEVEVNEGVFSTWRKPDLLDGPEILVPLDRDFRDYPIRIGEVLHALEVIEGRSQLEILSDIQAVTSDVLRVSAIDDGSADGTISLKKVAGLV